MMKALFFLRHYNDIDHITPVISKWAEAGHSCDVVLVGNPKFRHYYRVKFVSNLRNVRVDVIRDLLPSAEFLRWRFQMLLLSNSLRRSVMGPLVRVFNRFQDAGKREPTWRNSAKRLL